MQSVCLRNIEAVWWKLRRLACNRQAWFLLAGMVSFGVQHSVVNFRFFLDFREFRRPGMSRFPASHQEHRAERRLEDPAIGEGPQWGREVPKS